MRTRRTLIILWFYIFPAILLFSQQAPLPDRQAEALTRRSHAMLSGPVLVDDVTLKGKARRIAGSVDETGTVVLQALATGEARLEFSFPSGSFSQVIAQSAKGPVGEWTGPDGKVHEMKQHNLATDAAWFFPTLVLRRMTDAGKSSVARVGRETQDGKPVEHLMASRQFKEMPEGVAPFMEGLSRSEVYLDSSTLLPVSISFNTHPDSDALRNVPVEIRFSDYRSVNGAQAPFHVQKTINGRLAFDLQFETITVNSGLTPAIFSLQK